MDGLRKNESIDDHPDDDETEGLIEESIVHIAKQQHRPQRRKYFLVIIVFALVSLSVAALVLDFQTPINPNGTGDKIPISPSTKSYPMLIEKKIQNYRSGKALILNVHVTHHAGTALCQVIKMWGPTPTFACMGGDNWNDTILGSASDHPWTFNDTATHVELVRQYFHMVSWEYKSPPRLPLENVNWEYPNLVSVYVSRNPIDRLLAGDGIVNRWYGGFDKMTTENWTDYITKPQTNNYALNILTQGTCVDGRYTTQACLEKAKKLLSRFTFILDQDCLNEGIEALGLELNMTLPDSYHPSTPHSKMGKTARERIGYDDVYEALLEQNKVDIALYEWSKRISIVQCESNNEESHV